MGNETNSTEEVVLHIASAWHGTGTPPPAITANGSGDRWRNGWSGRSGGYGTAACGRRPTTRTLAPTPQDF